MTDTRAALGLLAHLGRRAGKARLAAAVGAAVVAGMAAVTVSLWLKLILDGVTEGDSSLVTLAAATLGATVTLQVAASSYSHLLLGEVKMACARVMMADLIEAGAAPPGIEHFERPDYADRIALLKRETNDLSSFVPVLGEAVGLNARVGVTGVLLARLHPVLLLLPALAVPSFYAGGRAERAINRAKEPPPSRTGSTSTCSASPRRRHPPRNCASSGWDQRSWPASGTPGVR